MNKFFIISALIGATLIIVRGTLFRRLQRWYPPLFECSQCTGMWVGAAAGASGIMSMGYGRAVDALIVGAATSFYAMAADAVLLKLLGDPKEGG